EPDRARERRAVPRVPVLELARAVRERVVDVLRADHRGQRRITRAEPLATADDVRHERQLLVREPAPGPPHAGHDLVEADEEAVFLPAFLEPAPELVRRRVRRIRRRTDRLAEEGRDGLVEDTVERVEIARRD